MGIYINGLKVPTSCCKCRFSRWSNYGQLYMCYVCEKPVAKFQSEYESTKPDWCPITEVPEPHGDLIDRDAFRTDYGMADECRNCKSDPRSCEFDRNYTKLDFCGWLDDAPTVIPREDGEDE